MHIVRLGHGRLLRASPVPSARCRGLNPRNAEPFRIEPPESRCRARAVPDAARVATHGARDWARIGACRNRRVRSALLLHRRGDCASMRPLREGGAWRRKRHGAPNREPPEIRSAQNAEPLCPVRGDDLPAGVVRISGPAPRPASLGMRSVRLQVRDPGHVPRPIVSHLPRVYVTKRRATGCVRWLCFRNYGLWELRATPISRAEIAPRSQPALPPMAAAVTPL